jgi:flavin reductase (DIM6/NTAB) family NADH-FMN oxidoreductase RutF
MAFERNELRRVMGHFATGVTIITTHDGAGRCYGLTANAVLSLDPGRSCWCASTSVPRATRRSGAPGPSW